MVMLLGDQLLSMCMQRVKSITRENDMLARIGGRRIRIVAPGPIGEDEANKVADMLRGRAAQAAAGTYKLGKQALQYTGVSLGTTTVRFVTTDQALALADVAMYRDKRDRKEARSKS